MKRLLLVFTLFNIGVASAQLKTYNGSFEDGSANYTYKEDVWAGYSDVQKSIAGVAP